MDILKSVLDVIILICEHSYSYTKLDSIENCSTSQTWNNIVYKSMVYGHDAKITKKEKNDILQVLNINIDLFLLIDKFKLYVHDLEISKEV